MPEIKLEIWQLVQRTDWQHLMHSKYVYIFFWKKNYTLYYKAKTMKFVLLLIQQSI